MDEQSVACLFDRYYRGTSTDTPTGSTGLGMANNGPYDDTCAADKLLSDVQHPAGLLRLHQEYCFLLI
ncbi:hypothetical protein ACFSTH_10615 [Paenibacillus yanchengensis]|uniref:Uncharacterized protein n=1 Tax=Paenibacillus yanchengensis TaxID=2035833 RepID=A0ABW4YJH1_9BACL